MQRDSATCPSRANLMCIGLGCLVIGGMLGATFGPEAWRWWFERQIATEFTEGFSPPVLQWLHGEGGDGAVGRMSTISSEPASLRDALMNLSPIRAAPCTQGRSSTWQMVEPEHLSGGPEFRFPAGTKFTQEFHCEGSLPNEFELAVGTTFDAARSAVEKRLGGAEASNPHRNVSRVSYNDRRPKYLVFRDHLGDMTASAISRCDGPVVVDQVVVGAYTHPTAEQRVFLNGSEIVVGSDIRCAGDVGQTLAALEP